MYSRVYDLGVRAAIMRMLVAVLALAVAGCHAYRPITTATPDEGLDVALQLNDRGGEALRDSVGPDVVRIEGRVDSRMDSLVVLRISHTQTASGMRSRWDGERIGVRPEWVRYAEQRQFSKQRTALLVGAAVAAVATAGVMSDGFGLGGGSDDKVPPDPEPTERRMPRSLNKTQDGPRAWNHEGAKPSICTLRRTQPSEIGC